MNALKLLKRDLKSLDFAHYSISRAGSKGQGCLGIHSISNVDCRLSLILPLSWQQKRRLLLPTLIFFSPRKLSISKRPSEVNAIVVSYFKGIASPYSSNGLCKVQDLIHPCLSELQLLFLSYAVSDSEIMAALLSIGDDEAPGPDGYTSLFFKKAWHIVGTDFVSAIKYFFSDGKILDAFNTTSISLVPKVLTTRLYPKFSLQNSNL
ncbi:hypothetical protein Vadar_008267 [Vaccinium darrowii]|uniref:Uncharacterized protein n=1 Tax=Vaccinium darrowii TaxID=229202 RepID=A0ACB7YUW9_9ERIC|nr:hypothetical protein Vadar_008267 [Vaccinium darrowii]